MLYINLIRNLLCFVTIILQKIKLESFFSETTKNIDFIKEKSCKLHQT